MAYIGSGFILFSHDLKKILLVHDTRSQKWGFPKGHKEDYDTNDLQTAIRECGEETNLTPNDYTIHNEPFRVSKGSQSYIFRYAVMNEYSKTYIQSSSTQEISEIRWISISDLLGADTVLDGNKYLRSWIADIQSGASKKSVHLFKSLLSQRLPSQESVSPTNVVTSA
jgi:8-oxo-dGTP pyrophosphatase MutT (NUDIX family)